MCGGDNSGDFGCLKCTESILGRKHGWIECKSKSFPGKVYYFHTMTRCSTWERPVPRTTKLPIYKKLRDSRLFESPMDDKTLPSSLNVSETESLILSSDVPPSDFELYTRRMQIYLQNNTDYNLTMKYGRGENLRDKLFEYYKTAKCELANNLREKSKAKKKTVRVPIVKPKTRPVKIIRECHGIKTVSYDPIIPGLSDGVRMPDLSETSVDSFTPVQGLQGRSDIDGKSFGQKFVSNDLNLSRSETTASDVVDCFV